MTSKPQRKKKRLNFHIYEDCIWEYTGSYSGVFGHWTLIEIEIFADTNLTIFWKCAGYKLSRVVCFFVFLWNYPNTIQMRTIHSINSFHSNSFNSIHSEFISPNNCKKMFEKHMQKHTFWQSLWNLFYHQKLITYYQISPMSMLILMK